MANQSIADLKATIESGPGYAYVLGRLTNAFDAALSNPGKHVDCPFPQNHLNGGGRNDFRLFPGFDNDGNAICSCCDKRCFDIFDLALHAGVGNTMAQVRDRIAEVLGDKSTEQHQYNAPKRTRPSDPYAEKNTPGKILFRRNLVMEVINGLIPLSDPRAAAGVKYLRESRGIGITRDHHWMFHPALEYYFNGYSYGQHPALVSRVLNKNGEVTALHKIYLTPEGAKVGSEFPEAKLCTPSIVYGDFKGGYAAIRTGTDSRDLHIGEGVELMSCVSRCVSEGDVISALNAPNMEEISVSRDDYDTVIIWADRDRYFPDRDKNKGGRGQMAARVLAKKLAMQGFNVHVFLPEQNVPQGAKSIDWEDVIVKGGILNLPPQKRFDKCIELAHKRWLALGKEIVAVAASA